MPTWYNIYPLVSSDMASWKIPCFNKKMHLQKRPIFQPAMLVYRYSFEAWLWMNIKNVLFSLDVPSRRQLNTTMMNKRGSEKKKTYTYFVYIYIYLKKNTRVFSSDASNKYGAHHFGLSEVPKKSPWIPNLVQNPPLFHPGDGGRSGDGRGQEFHKGE